MEGLGNLYYYIVPATIVVGTCVIYAFESYFKMEQHIKAEIEYHKAKIQDFIDAEIRSNEAKNGIDLSGLDGWLGPEDFLGP